MLLSYALFIFALASSVVAAPIHSGEASSPRPAEISSPRPAERPVPLHEGGSNALVEPKPYPMDPDHSSRGSRDAPPPRPDEGSSSKQ